MGKYCFSKSFLLVSVLLIGIIGFVVSVQFLQNQNYTLGSRAASIDTSKYCPGGSADKGFPIGYISMQKVDGVEVIYKCCGPYKSTQKSEWKGRNYAIWNTPPVCADDEVSETKASENIESPVANLKRNDPDALVDSPLYLNKFNHSLPVSYRIEGARDRSLLFDSDTSSSKTNSQSVSSESPPWPLIQEGGVIADISVLGGYTQQFTVDVVQESQVVKKIPVEVYFTEPEPRVGTSDVPVKETSKPTPLPVQPPTAPMVFVKAKVKCITVNDAKMTMTCMAKMIHPLACTLYKNFCKKSPVGCSENNFINSPMKSIKGTITFNGVDKRFQATYSGLEGNVSDDALMISKIFEKYGFWFSVKEAPSEYINQPVFLPLPDARPNEMNLVTDLEKLSLIVFAGNGEYLTYSLTEDTDTNPKTNGSCTDQNTL